MVKLVLVKEEFLAVLPGSSLLEALLIILLHIQWVSVVFPGSLLCSSVGV